MLLKDMRHSLRHHTRRGFLGASAVALSAAGLWEPQPAAAAGATDDSAPYPIPWLDKNLHHNQVPPPGVPTELAHIYHFKGQVGRALFKGQGQTNSGETLYIGQGTDYSYLRGDYIVASGDTRSGIFSHN